MATPEPFTAPPRATRRRLSFAAKLWIAALGFPTLLLLIVAGYTWWITPKLRLIDKVMRTSTVSNHEIEIRLFAPYVENTTSYEAPLLHRLFGDVTSIIPDAPILTADDLRLIGRTMHEVTQLNVDVVSGVTESDLQPLTELPRLKNLIVSESLPVTDAGLRTFSGMNSLEWMQINDARGITPGGLDLLQSLPRLTLLYLHRVRVNAEMISGIAKLSKLNQLRLGECELSDEEADQLLAIPSLQLSFYDVHVSAHVFKKLGSHAGLSALTVREAGYLPVDAFTGYPGASRLRWIQIDNDPSVNDDTLKRIAGITTLRTLDLNHCPITEEGVKQLHNHPSLMYVTLPDHISNEACWKLLFTLSKGAWVKRQSDPYGP